MVKKLVGQKLSYFRCNAAREKEEATAIFPACFNTEEGFLLFYLLGSIKPSILVARCSSTFGQ